jgi:integrase/recombinase XerD
MQIRFKHLVEDRDRHGNIRIYVRVPGRRKVRIRPPFGTDQFVTAYNAAVSDHVAAPRQAREAKAGSFRHLCVLYYGSATFKRLDRATQSWRRRALDSMCEQHAEKPVTRMEARHVRALRDERSDQPGAANTRLKALKALFAWACEEKPEIAPHNPTVGVRKIKYATDGHHSWTPEEIAQPGAASARQQGAFGSRPAALYRLPPGRCSTAWAAACSKRSSALPASEKRAPQSN